MIDKNSTEILHCKFNLIETRRERYPVLFRELHKVAEMDVNLSAISECVSLYYEVLALITSHYSTGSCLKVCDNLLYE